MRHTLLDNQKDTMTLMARVMLTALFVVFGWNKLTHFSATVAYMTATGAPLPAASAVVAIVMELAVGIALLAGFYTRPLAVLLALYTLATGFIGHHYWTMSGAAHYANMINFYKNVGIAGGLLLLCATGPGRYSLDGK